MATPKAGSTAIEAALEPLASVNMKRPDALKHMSAQNYHRHVAPYLRETTGVEFTTVALMREPDDWIASWYRFALRDFDPTDGIPMLTYDKFVKDYMVNTAMNNIGTQHEILCDTAGNKAVDHIFRYEKMDAFVLFLEDRLDCIITLPRINVPPKTDVALNRDTSTKLRQAMQMDHMLYDQLDT